MISLLFLLTILSPQYGVRTSTSLTVKLIHPTSPESPFYNGNLTQQERLQDLVSHSIARAHTFAYMTLHNKPSNSSISRRQLLRVRPMLRPGSQAGEILVDAQVGTFGRRAPNQYYLVMDTTIELTWLQCEGCRDRNKCFLQNSPPFSNSRSTSYVGLICDRHHLCHPGECIGNICSYSEVRNLGRLESMGFLSLERFTFLSNSGGTEIVPNLVFGCGIENEGNTTGEEAGIFGLGWGPRSIVSQLSSQTNERFSYCFPHYDQQGARSYLTFGADVNYGGGSFQQTALVKVAEHEHYYLRLDGITIAGKRLQIPQGVFTIRANGAGGMIIDVGTYVTHLISTAYTELVRLLDAYMVRIGNKRMQPGHGTNSVCYVKGQGPQSDQLPYILVHFTGDAVLRISPNNVFFRHDQGRVYCLAIEEIEDDESSILGSYQQSNIHFIYDQGQRLLSFRPENCGYYNQFMYQQT